MPVPAAPGSAEEVAAFAALQARLPAMFRSVFADPQAPRTIVVVPGLSVDGDVLASVAGGLHYEERQLAMLMLLRLPNTRLVFVSSTRIDPAIIDYHLGLLWDVPQEDARRRLVLFAAGDASPRTLTHKVLERPRLLERIRASIGDPALAHLTCFNATPCERTLAVRLGIPLYGCDPALADFGSKSGGRRVFRAAGLALPDGFEDLRDVRDVVAALGSLKRQHPELARAVVKLNHGFSGEGNAVFSFAGCPVEVAERWVAAHLPLNLAIEARHLSWDRYAAKLAEQGGIVECWVSGEGLRSPSVQMRITPLGELEFISTHDQILGGPSGQVFQACTMPADAAYASEIQSITHRVGEQLRREGVLGRFGVDFVSVPTAGGWRHHALEINLRKGGTTHTFQMLQFLTGGRYDPARSEFVTPEGDVRTYFATDNVVSPSYRSLTPEDLFEVAERRGLCYDRTARSGIVFGLVGALAECGKLGIVSIDVDCDSARRRFGRAVAVLDEEAARE
jgi:hypothetical protein